MNEYYGVPSTPNDSFLQHYGTKGMKWGVRKALNKSENGFRKSRAYSDAEKKLRRATMAGGLIGGAIYAHRHKDELNSAMNSRKRAKTKHQSELINGNSRKISSSDKNALKKLKKNINRGAVAGALTIGGGLGGGAIGALRYAKKNPKEYAKAKRAFKNMSFKDRMRYVYANS